MNRPIATLAQQISPLQVRQGLFFSLALLLTIIAGQLHHNWHLVQGARGVSDRVAQQNKAPVPTPTMLMQSQPAAVSTAPVDARAPRARWVF